MKLNYIRLVLFLILISVSKVATSQEREIEILKELGFENIQVVVDNSNSYISLDDRVYRGVVRGIEEVVSAMHQIDSTKTLNILLQNNGIPQISVIVPSDNNDITITYQTQELKELFKEVKQENSSFGKVDLVLYPELFLENSWLDKLYGVAVNLSPAVELSLWRGAKVTGQVVIPLYTNMLDEKQYIRPGVIAFSQYIRLYDQLYSTISIGNFTDDRIGVDATLNYYTKNGRWNIAARAGLTGSSTFYAGIWEVSMWRRFTWSGSASYYVPKYQLELTGQVMQMVYGDKGVYASARRYFDNVSVGLYAMITNGVANGGFTFSVALPTQRRAKRNGTVRVTYPEYFTRVYKARNGSKTLTGFSYDTSPTSGSMQDFYNPYYIKNQFINNQ